MTVKNEALLDILSFIAVLAIAAILLNFFLAVRPSMDFERREVAKHTSFFLNIFGVNSQVYDWSIKIPYQNPELENISSRLLVLGFEKNVYENGIGLKAAHLHPETEKIVDIYVLELMKKGLPVYVSKATIVLDDGFEAEIIPECVGWMGLFAVTALILAYPRVHWKKRLTGLFISWPLMHLMNILRLTVSLYTAHAVGLKAFEFTHDFLWKTVLLIWALCLWMFWIFFIVEGKRLRDIKIFKTKILKTKKRKAYF